MDKETEKELVVSLIEFALHQTEGEFGLRYGGFGPNKDFEIFYDEQKQIIETSTGSKYKIRIEEL